MHSVAESLLRSHHSVGSETDPTGRERASTRERARQKEREQTMNTVECIRSRKAIIQLEAKLQRRESSGAGWIQSEPPPKPPFSQEKKPTQSQGEKE
jgi:hypothetical protein